MYFVTTIDNDRTRCVGYFKNFNKAEEIIINNVGDIYEDGYYKWAIIEKIEEGLYQHDLKPIWYEWDKDLGQYKKLAKCPAEFKNLVGFSLG